MPWNSQARSFNPEAASVDAASGLNGWFQNCQQTIKQILPGFPNHRPLRTADSPLRLDAQAIGGNIPFSTIQFRCLSSWGT